jgi:hypothetical protein
MQTTDGHPEGQGPAHEEDGGLDEVRGELGFVAGGEEGGGQEGLQEVVEYQVGQDGGRVGESYDFVLK